METADLLWEQGTSGWEWAVADGNTANYSCAALREVYPDVRNSRINGVLPQVNP